ncbi:hypothetical protein SAMN05216593_103181 [Pseudomonas asturiensis]|uniref:Uncharacterized protein n=1 Tax=Pseudomonas asturiensis TaxID=1190415 RepID=A0A1M7LMH2_9PSED|nr:hypothetical protein [Pseudomonas asturiensis]SHM79371.1 hypothetical protein SAMN05216593_103181 [Pseudomonas asturiensis]
MALIQSLKWRLINRIAGKPPPTKTVSIQLVWCCLTSSSCLLAKAKNRLQEAVIQEVFRREHPTVGGGLRAMASSQSLKWRSRNRIAGKPPPTKNGVDPAGLVLFDEQ